MKEGKEVSQKTGMVLCAVGVVCLVASIAFSVVSLSDVQKMQKMKESIALEEDEAYSTKEDVAAYIYKYGHLPHNYITKFEAELAGWEGGALDNVLPGRVIGGDRFYAEYTVDNDLAKAVGRWYRECDVDPNNLERRTAERLVFTNDGLVYYTPDHYHTFELVYGQP